MAELSKSYSYVSILGSDVRSTAVRANRSTSAIGEGSMSECGFVITLHNGRSFFEYSLDDVQGDKKALAETILSALKVDASLA